MRFQVHDGGGMTDDAEGLLVPKAVRWLAGP